MQMGREYLARPVTGRYQAWRVFERAAQLAPHDPEPRYGQLQVGLYLRLDEGQRIARDAIFHILEITPDYKDIWRVWDAMYESDDNMRHAIDLLARFRTPLAARRRAMMLNDLDRFDEAGAVLDSLLVADPDNSGLLALRAEAAFGVDDTARALSWYYRAIANAAYDDDGILWRQIATIATPDEMDRWLDLNRFERSAFLEGFWAAREPDLTTPINERIPEHFARLRYVRDHYRLVHPMSYFHTSAEWRAMQVDSSMTLSGILRDVPEETSRFDTLTGRDTVIGLPTATGESRLERDLQNARVPSGDLRDLDQGSARTRYARLGFDGRGLLWMRRGRPRTMFVTSDGDAEGWTYEVNGRAEVIPLGRLSGDFLYIPGTAGQVATLERVMTTDETAVAAPNHFSGWLAWFRNEPSEPYDVYVRATVDTVAAAAWDSTSGLEVDRAVGPGPVKLRLRAGTYRFGVDHRDTLGLARVRRDITIPTLDDPVSLSSLLVVPGEDSVGSREDLVRAMPADLEVRRAGQPVTIYVELYGLRGVSGVTSYRVTWRFVRRGAAPISFQFDRRRPWAPTLTERLVVQPGDVPPGTYRIEVTVEDEVVGLEQSTARLDVKMR